MWLCGWVAEGLKGPNEDAGGGRGGLRFPARSPYVAIIIPLCPSTMDNYRRCQRHHFTTCCADFNPLQTFNPSKNVISRRLEKIHRQLRGALESPKQCQSSHFQSPPFPYLYLPVSCLYKKRKPTNQIQVKEIHYFILFNRLINEIMKYLGYKSQHFNQ